MLHKTVIMLFSRQTLAKALLNLHVTCSPTHLSFSLPQPHPPLPLPKFLILPTLFCWNRRIPHLNFYFFLDVVDIHFYGIWWLKISFFSFVLTHKSDSNQAIFCPGIMKVVCSYNLMAKNCHSPLSIWSYWHKRNGMLGCHCYFRKKIMHNFIKRWDDFEGA